MAGTPKHEISERQRRQNKIAQRTYRKRHKSNSSTGSIQNVPQTYLPGTTITDRSCDRSPGAGASQKSCLESVLVDERLDTPWQYRASPVTSPSSEHQQDALRIRGSTNLLEDCTGSLNLGPSSLADLSDDFLLDAWSSPTDGPANRNHQIGGSHYFLDTFPPSLLQTPIPFRASEMEHLTEGLLWNPDPSQNPCSDTFRNKYDISPQTARSLQEAPEWDHARSQKTPLHIAVESSNARSTRMLLQNGANIEATDAKGATALHIAVERQDSEIVDLLLENSASLNVNDNRGLSPLHIAATAHDCTIMWSLLRYGADPNISA